MNVLIIDNYDSFTFNLYQYVGEILHTELSQAQGNPKVSVKRNNEVTLEDIKSQNYDRIIISPGPGSPEDPAYFGVCSEVIKELGPSIPLLGVCLGMQVLLMYSVVMWYGLACLCMVRPLPFVMMDKGYIKGCRRILKLCATIH